MNLERIVDMTLSVSEIMQKMRDKRRSEGNCIL